MNENEQSDGGRLTAREKRFAEEYAATPNGVGAFFKAFGRTTANGRRRSYQAARTEASRLLTKPHIAAEIAAVGKSLSRRTRISALRVLRELAAVAFFDPVDVFDSDPVTGLPVPRPWADVHPAARRAIASVKVKRRRVRTTAGVDVIEEVEEVEYRFASKLDALDKLCKHLGLTKDGAALEKLLALIEEERATAGCETR